MHMRNQSGQTLVELMVSIVIITSALSAIVAIFPFIIQSNAKIQAQNKAALLAQSELETLKGLNYYDTSLDALGTVEGMNLLKEEGDYYVRIKVKYIDSKTGEAPETYPTDLSEDTGLKEIKVSVKRKDGIGNQADLVSHISKARPGKG